MARQSRDAITSSRNLPKPPVHAASNGFPARVDLAVDKNVLAAPQLCASNAWQWQGRRIVFPEHTENGVEVWNDKVTIQPAGRLPGGEFYVVRAGEYAWVEFKPRRGRAVKIQDAGVNGLLQVKDGVIAVFPGPASRTTFTDKDGNVIEYPKETVIIGDVDFTEIGRAHV